MGNMAQKLRDIRNRKGVSHPNQVKALLLRCAGREMQNISYTLNEVQRADWTMCIHHKLKR